MKGHLETNLMAGKGTDYNYILLSVPQKLMEESDSVTPQEREPAMTYRNVATDPVSPAFSQ